MAVAADVPAKYDLVLGTTGFIYDRALDGGSGRYRAEYTSTPTFVERQNTSQAFGDDQQAFWLTASQNDWSLGQDQLFYRQSDEARSRMYYVADAVDAGNPGQICLQPATTALSVAAGPVCGCGGGATIGVNNHYLFSPTKMYSVDVSGTVTDRGVHGAGAPSQWGATTDGVNVYVAGATTIRKWNGSGFADFGTNANSGALAFLNNTLYSCDGSALYSYDGSGTKSSAIFTWKDATATALPALGQIPRVFAYGSKLLIFFPNMPGKPSLWEYDGTSTTMVAELPRSAIGFDGTSVEGNVFLSGQIRGHPLASSTPGNTPVVWTWNGTSVEEVWRSTALGGTTMAINDPAMPPLGTVQGKLVFYDKGASLLISYDFSLGAVVSLASVGTSSGVPFVTSSATAVIVADSVGTAPAGFGFAGTYPSTGFLQTSVFDFDNTLSKNFHGVKVEFTQDGFAHGTVGVSYSMAPLTTNYTSLNTSVTSGVETLFPANVQGRGLSLKITLNTTGGTPGPTVTRVYLRAAPVQDSYETRVYNLDLSGDGQAQTVTLNDGTPDPQSGLVKAKALRALIKSTSTFTAVDRFGSFTALCEPSGCTVLELHGNGSNAAELGQFVAQVTVREV